jgi:hypothetical protein
MKRLMLLLVAIAALGATTPSQAQAQAQAQASGAHCYRCDQVSEHFWECDVYESGTFDTYTDCLADGNQCVSSGPCWPILLSQAAFDADGVLRETAKPKDVESQSMNERESAAGGARFSSGCLSILPRTYTAAAGDALRTETATITF